MDKNKIPVTLTPGSVQPVVAFANYMDVRPGAVWGERQIPDVELILVVEGRFRYETRQAPPSLVEAGDILLIPPGEWHTLKRIDTPGHAVFSCIHGELAPGLRWVKGDYRVAPIPPRITRTGGDAAIHDLFMRCAAVFAGYGKYRSELLSTILKEIWIRMAEHGEGRTEGRLPNRMRSMVAYLRAHLDGPVSRQSLAREFGLTPEHVNALFRKQLGITPTQFIHRERMLLAYRLLRDKGLSVKETAQRVGFNDPFYFSRVFKKVMRRSPGAV